MHRTGPAKGKDRKAVRVLATFQRMDASGISHTFISDLMNAPGRLFKRKPQRLGDTLLDSLLSGDKIELELTAKKIVRVKIAQHQVSISHRRLCTTQPVASRSRFSSRRFRPDLQQAQRIDACNRAAASADLDHFDYRHFDGQA